MGVVVEPQARGYRLVRHERRHPLVRLVVGEVEDAEAHEGDRPVRPHLREARAHLGDGTVARHLQGHHRRAEERDRLGERLGVETERDRVVRPLVKRAFRAPVSVLQPDGVGPADGGRRRDRERPAPDPERHPFRRG